MRSNISTVDQLTRDALNGAVSRRDLLKRASALGLSAPAIASLMAASRVAPAAAQEPVTLSFDAATTGGGGGKPNASLVDYCYLINGGSQFELNRMVDSRLITLSADLNEFVGELAESWEIEGTTARFNLHPNALWHDGAPLTARDVVFTINVLADPTSNSRWGASFASVQGYEEMLAAFATPAADPIRELSGVSAPDETTVVIELTQPDSGLLPGFIFINILPEHILGEVDRGQLCEQSYWTENRVGSGPFKFVQLVEGERIELEAFDDYFLGRPEIDQLNLLFFSSFETSLAAFQQGSIAAAPMTVLDVDLIDSLDFAEIRTTPAGVGSLLVNTQQPAFTDKRVRQAISYAIDRATITESLFRGFADPVTSEIPYLDWTQSADLNPYLYDPERARELLEEAGWTGDETYTLWYYYPDQLTATVMEAVQQYLAAVGINVELRFDDASGVRVQEFEEGTWFLTYGSFGAQPAPANLSIIWGCQARDTWTYCNPAFDEAMEAALRTYDREEQAEYYRTAIAILNEELPWVFLFDRKNLMAVNTERLDTGDTEVWGPGHIMYRNNVENWTVNP